MTFPGIRRTGRIYAICIFIKKYHKTYPQSAALRQSFLLILFFLKRKG